MGITIHYRGTLDDIGCIEQMEDRVMDLVFALGGTATVWRSFADHDPTRVVRGLVIEMTPGQDTFSLLVSPEGHLTPLFQIEEAERTAFAEPPWCFVKTQFGSLTGHVAVVHLLEALKQRYASNLEVSDEGEYYESRDIANLRHKKEFLDGAIRSMADGLREHGLSDEAMEDPEIVEARIERVAMLVQNKISGQADDHSDTATDDSDEDKWNEPSLEEEVQWMDAQRRKSDLRNERMVRRIAEATARGMSTDEAFRLAMSEEGLQIPGASDVSDADGSFNENIFAGGETEETSYAAVPDSWEEADEADFNQNHPVAKSAQEFLIRVMDFQNQQADSGGFASTLMRGAMEMMGGLAQATGHRLDDRSSRALAITQLKRALSGHAYARGAVFGHSSENAIAKEISDDLHEQLETIVASIHELLRDAWREVDW